MMAGRQSNEHVAKDLPENQFVKTSKKLENNVKKKKDIPKIEKVQEEAVSDDEEVEFDEEDLAELLNSLTIEDIMSFPEEIQQKLITLLIKENWEMTYQ